MGCSFARGAAPSGSATPGKQMLYARPVLLCKQGSSLTKDVGMVNPCPPGLALPPAEKHPARYPSTGGGYPVPAESKTAASNYRFPLLRGRRFT